MPPPDILTILNRIAYAYPEKHIAEGTIELYQAELNDIPASLLDQAVSHHIQTSPWFPHISDLRLAAQRLSGSTNFAVLDAAEKDFLAMEAFQSERDYFREALFDPQAWESLAHQFERAGRLYWAEELRGKALHIQKWEAANQKGEEYPPRPDRRRYAQWDRHK
jgi:hypothetical protein